MNTIKPSVIRRWLGWALLLALGSSLSAQVSNPVKRQTDLADAKKVILPKPITPVVADPFHSEAFNELVGLTNKPAVASNQPDARPTAPRNNRELLQAIANGLKPSGYFVLSGEPTLVFGQKRVKAGGVLTITFEGIEYTLEVTAIDRTNFTLRLNRDEFTRPVK